LSGQASAGAHVRALAARLNDRVVTGGRSLASLDEAGELDERDRPLLMAMLQASLRWHHRFDWQLGRLLDKPLRRRDGVLAALLRIGLTQIQALRIPDHAAVAATVAAADELGLGRARGLVNAVLRRYQRERADIDERTARETIARFSHPGWLIEALKNDWPDDWQNLLDANNVLPPLWLRVNRRRSTRAAYLERLQAGGLAARPAAAFPDAVLLAEACPVDRLPGFGDGLVSVQDAGAQRAADLMRLEPGLRVLDACAAPGGKTAHLLERCPGLAELVALDCDAARLERLTSNLIRLGLEATLVAQDATAPEIWFDGRRFDRVLVDAPCSATGVIRRHPDIKLLRRAGDLPGLTRLQGRLLDALWPLLEPGGRLVYVTCSLLQAENLGVTQGFVARAADAALAAFGSDEHFQLLPGETNTDGFYYACLDKLDDGDL
jgi:16S rRNA (cytosine967-C5)-methyltransferase